MSLSISHVVSSIDNESGGPSKSVTSLALHQAQLGMRVNIITQVSNNPLLKESSHPSLSIDFVEGSFNKALINILSLKHVDLLHGHGLWELPIHMMAKLARKNEIPYLITPRGMLEPWALNQSKWKKKLALALYQRKDLENAAALHATAQMELEQFRRLGFKNPIALIPNGIDLSEHVYKTDKEIKQHKNLLFLSRIHPKKGIELLIEAWANIDTGLKKDWKVQIAGNGKEAYVQELKQLIQQSGVASGVTIIGPQFGKDKKRVYKNADLFVLPTYSENFGIVVAEALAYGVPVITTKGAPWEDLVTHKAGWWVDIGAAPLKRSLEDALQTSQKELEAMGLRGRQLVEQNYSIEQVAKGSIEMYQWILNERKKPEFIDVL